MAATIFHDDDADLSIVSGRRVAVLGYGSQGHAHALSLRDSGVDVRVGLPDGSASRAKAENEGLPVLAPYDACGDADLVMMLAPDTVQRSLYAEAVRPNLVDGDALLFGHGFTICYDLITPPAGVDVALISPTAPGHLVRRQFVDGKGVPCLVAVEQDATGNALALALSYAKAIGGTRAGVIATTFAEEAEAELFGEQAVRGGLSSLVRAGFETLVAAGCQPEIAYLACLREMNLAVELMDESVSGRRSALSGTAVYGERTRGPRVIDDHVRASMRQVLAEIRDGTFAREWVAEDESGGPEPGRLLRKAAGSPIEEVGRQLRPMMPWLDRPTTETG